MYVNKITVIVFQALYFMNPLKNIVFSASLRLKKIWYFLILIPFLIQKIYVRETVY